MDKGWVLDKYTYDFSGFFYFMVFIFFVFLLIGFGAWYVGSQKRDLEEVGDPVGDYEGGCCNALYCFNLHDNFFRIFFDDSYLSKDDPALSYLDSS